MFFEEEHMKEYISIGECINKNVNEVKLVMTSIKYQEIGKFLLSLIHFNTF